MVKSIQFSPLLPIEHRFPKPGVASSNLAGGSSNPSNLIIFAGRLRVSFGFRCSFHHFQSFFNSLCRFFVGFFTLTESVQRGV